MKDLDTVYRQHAQTVYKFLLSQCRDPQTAEELTQETFYQAVRSIDRFDGSCKVSVWLCQIAKHLWYQNLRKRKPEEPLPEDSPLWDVPNLLLTSHVAGGLRLPVTRENCVRLALENLKRYLAGEPLENVVRRG